MRRYSRTRSSPVDSGALIAARKDGFMAWIVGHFPPGQFGRYLIVGLVNTAFGYGTYAGLTALFTPHIPFAYVTAGVISCFTNITFAFLSYKWLIFKTKGNYLREWSRCVAVYGGIYALAILLLPLSVYLVQLLTRADRLAPYIAGAVQMAILSILGFLGHKNYSFGAGPS